MKSEPNCEFLLQALLQYWEQPSETAVLYTGVLSLALNRLIDVMFVPHTRRTLLPWPPVLPPNTDIIQTPEEARRVALALASYAITPSTEMAGQEEVVPYSGDDFSEEYPAWFGTPGVIFYTTLDEYQTLADEVLLVIQRQPGYHEGLSSLKMEGTALLDFLRRRVIASPFFKPSDHRTLIRGWATK